MAFGRCPPLRPFPARRGKRLAPGWWWSSTNGRLVHYGSAAMRLHVMLLDRDPRFISLAAWPLELRWREPGGVRAHASQLMLRLADGQGVLADCTTRRELSPRQRSLASVVGLAVLGARAGRPGLPAQQPGCPATGTRGCRPFDPAALIPSPGTVLGSWITRACLQYHQLRPPTHAADAHTPGAPPSNTPKRSPRPTAT
ncbi:TnsA-like heteromeric transposase endonuclease subunit [Streptomyces sirii]|uniref:TnsA-like heteromeric transposase endonuclease subunit n=1 Tax=Streptomyces sirii TaxID=3127701 RepID=UPI003D3629B1